MGKAGVDLQTESSTLILILDGPLFIARRVLLPTKQGISCQMFFYESRVCDMALKQNDNSTMNFNDQLLNCSFLSCPHRSRLLRML